MIDEKLKYKITEMDDKLNLIVACLARLLKEQEGNYVIETLRDIKDAYGDDEKYKLYKPKEKL